MTTTEIIPQEIFDTPATIRATFTESRPAAREAAALIHARSPRRIFIIGNGTSLYSSMAATYTARAFGDPSSPLVLAVPAGDFRYYPPALQKEDVVVGMSASGEFRDVLAIFERLQGQCLCIGITHIPGSSITHLADHIIMSSGGASRVPVMTKTYASTLTALHLLLLETLNAPAAAFDDLYASSDRCAGALAEAEKRIPDIVKVISKFEHAYYFGAGNAFAAALEGALKMKEMAILHAEGAETWEMASGPATLVSEQNLCTALYAGGDGEESTADTANHARQWGARVLEVGPAAPAGDWHFPVTAPGVPAFASLSLVPPLALLAYRNAQARGHDPDHPAWRERYISQGMTHILGE
jgi:glucosamine--fructose-6-phosphate aminotransferase (isomerizing)